MGDVAESILNGDECQECGEYIGFGYGVPRSCAGCDPKGDEATHLLHPAEPRRRGVQRRARRADATTEFDEVCQLARANGLRLRCCTDAHYQLKHVRKDWLLNIYPGNRRLYHDPQRMGPFLRVPNNWTLLDVVRAAVKLERGVEAIR